ncbi:Rgp1-domain-containing protein [Staphylotrichum tortipilum]|uniref:Rgp1-domain-containing protein n=1 Tax=Staphylotrichum tortipilum TaxID=2831512 RepID=A0AAN6MKA9_9PEZI|nr:Rgp1-domain-containing protein [Staphylotrichum longicolle]
MAATTPNNTPPPSASNIRVFVRWHDHVVFAGEEVKCTITFKNVARTGAQPTPSHTTPNSRTPPLSSTSSSSSQQYPPSASRHPNLPGAPPRQPSPLRPGGGRAKPTPSSSGLAPPPAHARGHRSTLSLTVPARARGGSVSWTPPAAPGPVGGNGAAAGGGGAGHRGGHGHKRSVSIVSIGSSLSTVEDAAAPKTQRPRGHARASSLQILPRGGLGLGGGPRSATNPRIHASQSSPLFHASYPPERSINGRRPGVATAPDTPRAGFRRSPTSPNPLAEFRFPMSPSPTSIGTPDEDLMSPVSSGLPTRTRELVPTINEQGVAPSARVLATTSIAGTPRSSGELYSLSNNSSETLASEYVTQQPLRTQVRSPHSRRTSSLAPAAVRLPESLMMGYAQIQGSFTLDGSLINLGPFEAVKRKAVVGGQGGGVIGLEKPKRDSGLLRGFGWGNITSNITSSIGELLGGGELSSIKEMRGIANSKAIPLLSTPQSILFVDLQLAPGESRAYEYSFKLPKGLPPTHRGKAMKISYSLVIGTQRPGGAKEQRVKSVDVPFRVLGSVNSHGEILGHDLMLPYILLRDQAQVQAVTAGQGKSSSKKKPPHPSSSAASTQSSFLTYVDDLLARPQPTAHHSSNALLSPTAASPIPPLRSPTSSRRPSVISLTDAAHPSYVPPTAKEAIDLAILRANLSSPGSNSAAPGQAPNRFDIARNGRRVATVMLARPAYRLGESVSCVVDFTRAEVQCYALHAALETTERVVDPGLALRSEASVARVTRKVWWAGSEACLFARRVAFAPVIAAGATPEFVTSGVGLEWKVRLEFVVPVQQQQQTQQQVQGAQGLGIDGGGDRAGHQRRPSKAAVVAAMPGQPHPLLEEISRDERGGTVLVGIESLTCESFEVAVPLKVYGAACEGVERLERDEVMEEGLPV